MVSKTRYGVSDEKSTILRDIEELIVVSIAVLVDILTVMVQLSL